MYIKIFFANILLIFLLFSLFLSFYFNKYYFAFKLYRNFHNSLSFMVNYDSKIIMQIINRSICHSAQTQNSIGFLLWKWDTLLTYFHSKNLVRIVFYVLWCTWGKALLDFCHENKAKCYWIFTVEIWHQFETHWESID